MCRFKYRFVIDYQSNKEMRIVTSLGKQYPATSKPDIAAPSPIA